MSHAKTFHQWPPPSFYTDRIHNLLYPNCTALQLSLFVSNFNFYSIYPLYPRTGSVIAQTAVKSRVATATDLPISFTFRN